MKERQIKPKVFETRAVLKSLEQKDRGKDKKNQHTKFVILTPHVNDKQFSELCRNDGVRITLKVEYLPYTKKIEYSGSRHYS